MLKEYTTTFINIWGFLISCLC